MFARTFGEVIYGLDGVLVTVEVDISSGLPAFEIVGLADTAVKEARERVRAAIKNSGFVFPKTKITVNLAPADIKKEGSSLDLAIAVGILAASGQICKEQAWQAVFLGELSLEGLVRKVSGVLPMVLHAKEQAKEKFFLPGGNAREASLTDVKELYPVSNLAELVNHLNGQTKLPFYKEEPKELFSREETYSDDFADVQGQFTAKRALEIAAAGGHNILLVGSPGSGKTMLAKRLKTILPKMSKQEALEVVKIYSVAGLLDLQNSTYLDRPFRSPHHTVSYAGLIGGGRIPRPGEVTLSHNGILFLDEFPEFSRASLEVLRQPLEDGEVTISRVQASLRYPARFILAAAMNPCPCGYQGDSSRICSCSLPEIERYKKKLSGPLLDRIDLQVFVPRLEYKELQQAAGEGDSSALIRKRVEQARSRQRERLQGTGLYCNAHLGHREVKELLHLEKEAQIFLQRVFDTLNLSARSHDRILKVAQTIADLAESEIITASHLAEAINLRTSFKA